MTNVSPEPETTNPFRRAFGDKARDPASVVDAMRQAEQDKWERDADVMESYNLDWALLFAPAVFLFGLFRNTDTSHIAYMMWALADVFWTPWLILRVDRRRPPGDTAKVAAFLGYAHLGWPLSALAIQLMPVRWEFLTAFPIVLVWSVAFAVRGARPRPGKPQPSSRRAAMLAGGALAWLACALLLIAAAALLWARGRQVIGDTAPLVFGAIYAAAALMVVPGLCLAPVASRTWRQARAAANPQSAA